MPKRGITWNDKLRASREAEVKRLGKPFAGMPIGGLMLIASPLIIDEYIRRIPYGRTVTVKSMRNDLADQHQAEFTCPTSTGIFPHRRRSGLERRWRVHPWNRSLPSGASLIPTLRSPRSWHAALISSPGSAVTSTSHPRAIA